MTGFLRLPTQNVKTGEDVMKKHIKEMAVIILGWFFIVLGIAGLFLPILQGVLFLLIGLFLLSKRSLWARAILNKLRDRYPSLYAKAKAGRQKLNLYLLKMLRKG